MNVIKIRVALVVMRFFKWQNIPKLLARYLQIIIIMITWAGRLLAKALARRFKERFKGCYGGYIFIWWVLRTWSG